jgi:exopolysaccharide biosynthesis predicted pyruvyltransferase EpsI
MDHSTDIMMDIGCTGALAKLFSQNRQRDWYFVSPGGNWGDHLIYVGAESLARSLGLRWIDLDFRTINDHRIPDGAGIYLHGSGGFNPWYENRPFDNLHKALQVPDSLVIQGPQTCDTEDARTTALWKATFDGALSKQVHIISRERTTASFLSESLKGLVQLHLDHDTALHLSRDELLSLAGLGAPELGRYRLVVSREDDEAPAQFMSGAGDAVVMDPAGFAKSFPHWLRIHARAKSIVTNRLHSAIVGSLLGKPVCLLPGSYHKNQSVWEFSLRERGVKWLDAMNESGQGSGLETWLPRRVAQSWKVQRALLWLRGVPLA